MARYRPDIGEHDWARSPGQRWCRVPCGYRDHDGRQDVACVTVTRNVHGEWTVAVHVDRKLKTVDRYKTGGTLCFPDPVDLDRFLWVMDEARERALSLNRKARVLL